MAIEILTFPKQIVIEFDDHVASMDLHTDEEGELVKTLLYSNDFWAQFLGSLSAALGRHR